MEKPGLVVREGVALAPLTTLELGGPAEWFAEVGDLEQLREALDFAASRKLPVTVLGGGSNVLVADEGVAGLVLRPLVRRLDIDDGGRVVVGAGEPWDLVVAATVDRGLAGFECLAGIPGLAGATPIQNVGAYGQEIGDTLVEVLAWDLQQGRLERIPAAECGLGYRSSRFKQEPGRWVVLEVEFQLRPGGPDRPRYPELAARLGPSPSLAEVRDVVLELRRSKSMVIDPADPNRRSAGSFFVNPVVSPELAEQVAAASSAGAEMPRWSMGDGRVKLSAAWLIEQAGFPRGSRRGAVGQSTRHALALVHHGGGTARELINYAEAIQAAVLGRFGVSLTAEPRFLGFGDGASLACAGPQREARSAPLGSL